MSYIDNMRVILRSRDAAPDYKERTRQQVIHLAWSGNPEAIELVGVQESKDCPCVICAHQRNLEKVRGELYK